MKRKRGKIKIENLFKFKVYGKLFFQVTQGVNLCFYEKFSRDPVPLRHVEIFMVN